MGEVKKESTKVDISGSEQNERWDLFFEGYKSEKPKKSIPEPKTKTTKQANSGTIDILDIKDTGSALLDIDWATGFGGDSKSSIEQPKGNVLKGNFANLQDDPFAALETGIEQTSSKPKIQAYKLSHVKKKEDTNIDDFFDELSKNK